MGSIWAIRIVAWALLVLTVNGATHAQLSPGELADVHAHLEGLSKCTECHVLGEKVSNDKCLGCHENISSLIQAGRGLHANSTVKSQDCFACHSDHHGRNFDMVRFNEGDFDHELTGYTLTGRHATIDCRQCHQPDYIADSEISSRDGTFLGLSASCAGCHDDYHQGTLTNDCASCHNTEGFRPAPGFDHSATDFALTGRHLEVDCAECHETVVVNSVAMQRFAGVSFVSCASCHDDVHDGRFGVSCIDCHTTQSFGAGTSGSFDHARTGFELVGSHTGLDCAACHAPGNTASAGYRDYAHLEAINCINCHTDIHEGRFGTDCSSCHNEISFVNAELTSGFDHAMTAFPLEGRHAEVTCAECHGESKTDAVPHATCMACHDDYHEDQFEAPECAGCHTVAGFSPAAFGFEEHDRTAFPLVGAHMATPCIDCHRGTNGWEFVAISTTCAGCHGDVHEGHLDASYYPGQACTGCHSQESWTEIAFDHSTTNFALEGLHVKVSCGDCHLTGDPEEVVFKGVNNQCHQCHEEVHGGQFEVSGLTDCTACHYPAGWTELVFVHDSTRFPLDGAHLAVSCTQCHSQGQTASGVSTLIYRSTPLECAACHN